MGDLEADVDAAWEQQVAESEERSQQARGARDLQVQHDTEAVRSQFLREVGADYAQQLDVRYHYADGITPRRMGVHFARYGADWRLVPGDVGPTAARPLGPTWAIQFRWQDTPDAAWRGHVGDSVGDPATALPGKVKDQLLRVLGEVKSHVAKGVSS